MLALFQRMPGGKNTQGGRKISSFIFGGPFLVPNLRQNLHSKQMPRQHLRALFSDSSSGVLSKHGCFLVSPRLLGNTLSPLPSRKPAPEAC